MIVPKFYNIEDELFYLRIQILDFAERYEKTHPINAIDVGCMKRTAEIIDDVRTVFLMDRLDKEKGAK